MWKSFSADKEQLEYAKNSVGTQAKKHIREFHKMDIKDYVVKHYFNGITPTCECGCGKDVTFTPKIVFGQKDMDLENIVIVRIKLLITSELI